MRKFAIFAARNMNIPQKFSNRSKTIRARLIRRVLYLLLFLCALVGLLIFAPQVFAANLDDIKTGHVIYFDSGRIPESGTPSN